MGSFVSIPIIIFLVCVFVAVSAIKMWMYSIDHPSKKQKNSKVK